MKKAVFSPLILAFLILFAAIWIPNRWLENFISKSRISEAATELNPSMFQGIYIQREMLNDPHYLPMYGSSELSRLDQFHPSDYFQVNYDGFTPFLVGRGGTESLIHFLNFSVDTNLLKGKKLVFIVSPQWFVPQGTDESHFDPNYSPLHAYDLAFNRTIDPNLKKKVISRLLLFSPVKNDRMLSILYKAEIDQNPLIQGEAAFVRPFAYAYLRLLEKKDLYNSYVGGTPSKRIINKQVQNKSWPQLEKMAVQVGRSQATNNRFDVINSQFDSIKKDFRSYKNYKKGASYGQSVQYYDFQLLLDLLKESGAKPLFISIPVNGKWYDYTGFPKQGRISYYNRIKKQIEANGFPIADFSGHEYDPYFLKDTIHIGWKGWVYTDQAIETFYNQNRSCMTLAEAKK